MNSRLTPLFAALALAAVLQAPAAYATAIVSATQVTANPGDTVTVSMTVSDDGLSGFNMNGIFSWDFRLRWDYAALGALSGSSTMTINGVTRDMASLASYLGGEGSIINDGLESGTNGTYYLQWLANTSVDFGSGYTFDAKFTIPGGAAAGPHEIDFVSSDGFADSALADDTFTNEDHYGLTILANPPMKVTVNVPAPAPAPEPGVLGLLIGGLGVLGAARLRRRAS
ncbi:MAG: PEP-CTERM sorting domain-containing protein [Gallionellaceae bacterium]|nr:PEP-CTERM sorting domain-containing protein [Gallionellaceae bacterium]